MADLIALYSSGPSSGKSEVARLLVQRHHFTVVKLAATIKEMVSMMLLGLGIPLSELSRYTEGDLKETPIPALGRSPRYLYQTLGTEWGRQLVNPKVWTTIAVARCQRQLDLGYNVVVDDMRFPNELEALTEAGAVAVRVARPGLAMAFSEHPSEGLLDDIAMDYVLVNDGTLDDLAENVSILLEDLHL